MRVLATENMFGNSSTPQGRSGDKKRRNLEFDFAGLGRPGKKKPRAARKSSALATPATTLDSPVPTSAAPRVSLSQTQTPTPTSPSIETQPIITPQPSNKPEDIMTQPNPTPITASRSIDRQLKEQKAVSSLLHGAGLALVCTILFFAGLASLGGYVLYRQMQDQSATLALLEQNTKQRMFEMEMDLIKRDNDLAKNLEQANLRVTALTSQFEEYRYQTTQTLAELRSRNRELEKQLSLNQRKLSDQQSILARLR
jgi:hypothetical protein